MENKTALENAGFQEAANNQLIIKKHNTVIYINPKDLHAEVYVDGLNFPTIIKKLKDLEDVKAFCYGHLGYHLNFTEKPKYDWETVKAKLSKDNLQLFVGASNELYRLGVYKVIDPLEAQSTIAKLKLNIIIQQIDKDYPTENKEDVNFKLGIVYLQDGVVTASDIHNEYKGLEFRIVTASPKGAKILLDQNPQLLQNLFKIETDATGED